MVVFAIVCENLRTKFNSVSPKSRFSFVINQSFDLLHTTRPPIFILIYIAYNIIDAIFLLLPLLPWWYISGFIIRHLRKGWKNVGFAIYKYDFLLEGGWVVRKNQIAQGKGWRRRPGIPMIDKALYTSALPSLRLLPNVKGINTV